MASISPKHREPNGRAKRDNTKAALEAADRAQRLKVQKTVMDQPHRQGSTDQKCATALGQFCMRYKLRDECYRAGEEYGLLHRRWQMVIAGIKPEGHKGSGNVQEEVTQELARKLTSRVEDAEDALRSAIVPNAYPWVRHITVDFPTQDIRELPAISRNPITYGLLALAVHFGMLPVDKSR